MTWRTTARLTLIALLVVTGAGVTLAHYPFVHYTTGTSPFGIAPERFDVSALPEGKLQYFLVGAGPEKLASGDSFAAVLSQIRLAAATWNGVKTSALRLEFGGFAASAQPGSASPGVDVLFEELPPGLVAMGGPTEFSPMVTREDGSFVPVTRSVLVLGKDLSSRPSYGEAFFLTAVHELGHALGLQHTFTSSAMSTEATRSTSRAKPLAADDEAGVSLLYPAKGYRASTGSISGRVTLDGQGVHLASVVALEPSGSAFSTLSAPDGYYEITGLPPGVYYLYAHPLPPAVQKDLGPADIRLPLDPDGKPVPAGPLFETVFYPDAKSVPETNTIDVEAGKVRTGFDFQVRPKTALDTYGIVTYSFPGSQYAVKPAFLNLNGGRKYLLALGPKLVSNNAPAPGLRVDAVGGSAVVQEDLTTAYVPSDPLYPAYLQLFFSFHPFAADGPRHLVFTLPGDVFVLPAGLHLVRSQPPSIASAVASPSESSPRAVTLRGSNLTPFSRVFFDGVQGTVTGYDWETGGLTVIPPQGASGHRAVVVALEADGQSSMFLDALAPPTFQYADSALPLATVSPSVLSAGTEAMIEITGVNTGFESGQTVLGFGSSDVTVRRTWVLGPDRLLANVHVAASAEPGSLALTLITGFQMVRVQDALQIQPARQGALVPDPAVINPDTQQASIFAGGKALLSVANLPQGVSPSVSLSLNDLSAAVELIQENRILWRVPSDLGTGPAVLRLTVNGEAVSPIVVNVDPAPPVIQSVWNIYGVPVSAERPLHAGDLMLVTVRGVDDAGELSISIGGITHIPDRIYDSDSDVRTLAITISPRVTPDGAVPLTAAIGNRVSQTVTVVIAEP